VIFWTAIAAACSGPQSYEVEVEVGGKATDPSADIELAHCESAPQVTWDNWVWGMLTTHCQGCHASTTDNSYGVPGGIHFDTEAETLLWKEQIRTRVLGQEDMPPAGGLMEDDLYLLQVWLDCWSGT
jgi:uncharacterized membrane protein